MFSQVLRLLAGSVIGLGLVVTAVTPVHATQQPPANSCPTLIEELENKSDFIVEAVASPVEDGAVLIMLMDKNAGQVSFYNIGYITEIDMETGLPALSSVLNLATSENAGEHPRLSRIRGNTFCADLVLVLREGQRSPVYGEFTTLQDALNHIADWTAKLKF